MDADVNYKTAKDFTESVKEKAMGQNVLTAVKPGEMMTKLVHDELVALMGGASADINIKKSPSIILIAGLQGSGKTTFTGKLANLLKTKRSKNPVITSYSIHYTKLYEKHLVQYVLQHSLWHWHFRFVIQELSIFHLYLR